MGDELSVNETIEIDAPVAEVWAALADPQVLAMWWPGMHLAVIEGGTFTEHWTDEGGVGRVTSGHVVECRPQEHVALVWADSDWPASTRVAMTIEPVAPSTTLVGLRHSGWEHLPNGARLAVAHRDGWRRHLADWARVASRRSEPR